MLDDPSTTSAILPLRAASLTQHVCLAVSARNRNPAHSPACLCACPICLPGWPGRPAGSFTSPCPPAFLSAVGTVVGISIAILVVLFAAQSFGTHKISAAFSPIMLLWFMANAAIGLVRCYGPCSSLLSCRSHHSCACRCLGCSFHGPPACHLCGSLADSHNPPSFFLPCSTTSSTMAPPSSGPSRPPTCITTGVAAPGRRGGSWGRSCCVSRALRPSMPTWATSPAQPSGWVHPASAKEAIAVV